MRSITLIPKISKRLELLIPRTKHLSTKHATYVNISKDKQCILPCKFHLGKGAIANTNTKKTIIY